ncbi:MBL fold metallo-hydrolase [Clostridium fallax]|uniref:Glyoxylase, beta-lactamase superfamily II n=1 Tax=Clostridium fallax TaxID=1533 RepID=A0A1M4VXA4_9CLOT|nr:MBL fold metallo-hydrolase [Clostridium fallax]SHE73545.1 Glyoxylase, beta-lactamase superfamily II [Clostridium fallax]SQB07739.1 Zn-dependent hydrolase [Clostridium fallax]
MLKKLTDRVYYMDYVEKGDRPVLGLVCGDNYSVVIDSGNSYNHTMEFLKEVERLKLPKIKYLLITHWHWDHVFGISTMKKITGCTVIANNLTNEKIKWMKTLKWDDNSIDERVKNGEEIEFCSENIKLEMPKERENIKLESADIVFDKKINIDLGESNCIVELIGGDHSKDSSIVYIPEEKVLFLGDSLYLDMYHGEWSYSREKLYPMMEKINKYKSNYYIPSHHNMYSNKEIKEFFNYLKTVGDIVEESIDINICKDSFFNKLGREPKEEEINDMNSFVLGNIKNKKRV